MDPQLFRQRLLELAAEYEAVHASSRSSARTPLGGPSLAGRRGSDATPAKRWSSPRAPSCASSVDVDRLHLGDIHCKRQTRKANPTLASLPGAAPEEHEEGGAGPPGAACRSGGAEQGGTGEGSPPAAPSPSSPAGRTHLGAPPAEGPSREPPRVSLPPRATQRKRLSGGWRLQAGTSPPGGQTTASALSRFSMMTSRSVSSRVSAFSAMRPSCVSLKGLWQFNRAVRRTEGSMRMLSTVLSMDKEESSLTWFVKSRRFTVLIACLIILSTVFIGVETQLLSSQAYRGSGSEQTLHALSAANYALTLLFTLEITARLYVFRADFFVEERIWNLFDLLILFLALVEVALEFGMYAISGGGGGSFFDSGGTAKLLRLFRLTRLLRLVRTFRQLKPLRMLVHSIYCAAKSVFWALMLLFMIVYSFGVILTQAVTEHTKGGRQVEDESLRAYYGSLHRSMLSLWMAVSGGINWTELIDPLARMGSAMWVASFLVYIAFVYFFILNVVTGVFCQNAIEGAQQDLELNIEAHLREKQVYADRLKKLFRELAYPGDLNDGLTAAEVQWQLNQPKVQSWFQTLDIDAKQAWKLFRILDTDRTGTISHEDFVEGCLKLRGPATRVDVESLKWEIRSASSHAEHAAARVARLAGAVEKGLARQGSAFSSAFERGLARQGSAASAVRERRSTRSPTT